MNKTSTEYNFWLVRVFSLLVFSFLSFYSLSQKEANNWYFGNKAGITFNTAKVSTLTNGKLSTSEGCATISDKNGDLLFYTDGISVWDNTHSITPNGKGLLGNSSSTQSAIIVPRPANPNQFYIFTVDDVAGSDGLEYSLFDLTLNSGKGDVVSTQKNVKLLNSSCEKITAVLNSNGKDYWVLTHQFESDNIYAYAVSSSGVNATPVKSVTGLKISSPINNTLGYLKVSPDGIKIAYANWTFDKCAIGDFNSSSGKVTNVWQFIVDDAYGLEFSASSNYIYLAEMYKFNIYQFNAKAKTKTDFLNSQVSIDNLNAGPIGALQLGPDKKIYICRHGKNTLDVIHAPDSMGSACRVQYKYVDLLGNSCNYGLPTFIQSFLRTDFSFKGNCFGDTAWFSIGDSTMVDSVHWYFGDVASNAKNTAKGNRVFHIFSDSGTFQVSTISFKGKLRDTTYLNISIKTAPKADFIINSPDCNTKSIVVIDNSDPIFTKYLWFIPDVDKIETSEKKGTFKVNDTGTYNIKFIPWFLSEGQYELSCLDTVSKQVRITNKKLIIPNVFTPGNGDKLNDVFDIITEGVEEYDLSIFNRWGQIIFSSKKDGIGNDGNNWTGRPNSNSELYPDGTYFYILNYKFSCEEKKYNAHGIITLIGAKD
ncbi:MAG: gliding motility-associated C-terminal domain-containing protein [Bacteroidia bacterium]